MTGAAALAAGLGALSGAGVFLLGAALRRRPRVVAPADPWLRRMARDLAGGRGALALLAGLGTLAVTRWVVAAAGMAMLVLGWRKLAGAAGERATLARLESLANWTESLRDTIAGAAGLEQAIPASLRVAAPALREPLERLVERLHTRVPMAQALRAFAADLADPGADLVVAALIINAQLRGPGLRDLLGELSRSVREELDMRRRVHAERRSIRRSAQIVAGISVGLALALAVFDHGYVQVYDTASGQAVLMVVAALYAGGLVWMRALARIDAPARLLAGGYPPGEGTAPGAPATGPGGAW